MGLIAQKDLSRLFVSAGETERPEAVVINGKFPQWLVGNFFQTGPGLVDLPHFTMNDYLDGYAILTKLEISNQTVKLTERYPETESYKKALELGKPYFMEYGTTPKREGSKSGLMSKILTTLSRDDMSDNCSASVYLLGSSLIAASATSFISKINAESLCQEQRYDLKKHLGQNRYGCHPLLDEEGTMWNMGFSVFPAVKYNILKIPRATSKDVETGTVLSKGSTVASISPRWNGALSLNHSFGISQHFIIFIEQPYVIKISRVLAATIKDYPVKWLEWRGSDKCRFYIVKKANGKVHATEYLSSESFFFLHIANCYEEDDKIIVDVATAKTPSSTEATSLAKLRNSIIEEVDPWIIERYIIPLIDSIKSVPEYTNLIYIKPSPNPNTTAQAVRKGNSVFLNPEVIFSRGADRAIINPSRIGKKHLYIYATGSFLSLADPENKIMAHSICKINTMTKEVTMWTASDDHFLGEPVFVPRTYSDGDDEDDGVILGAASSPRTNKKDFLVVLDGKSFKEMGTAEFKNHIPIGMHGIFVPQ